MSDDDAGLTSGDVTTQLDAILRRHGVSDIRALPGHLVMTGEHRCGECLSHGVYPKRLLAKIAIDNQHHRHGLPDMVMGPPDSLAPAMCAYCSRTYFIEPVSEEDPEP